MDPVYLFNPDKFIKYIEPNPCPLCGHALAPGDTHRQFIDNGTGLPDFGCRVSIFCRYPAKLGTISNID